jgi:hypothetical protein
VLGNQAFTAIDKCLAKTPDMKVRTLENICQTLCESRIMYSVELWGLDEAWEEVDRIHGRFFKKILGLPRCAENGMADTELGRDIRRTEAVWLAVKYWQRIMHMGVQDPVRQCYECQKGNMRFESWAKKMKEELDLHTFGIVSRNVTPTD